MPHDAPHCYGKFQASDRCRDCLYCGSCKYYTESARGLNRGFKIVSVERLGDWSGSLTDPAPGPDRFDEEDDEPKFGFSELAAFLRYLMELDTYTLEILREIISPASGRPCTVADLGRLHGISRQSMHRKIFRTIRRHPELAKLLRSTLSRMPPRRRTA